MHFSIFNRLGPITSVTDGRTDGQTDRLKFSVAIYFLLYSEVHSNYCAVHLILQVRRASTVVK